MREKISNAIRNHKKGLMEKNQIIAQKGREVKLENEYIHDLKKQSIDERNKQVCQTIKSQEKGYLDKKKRSEVHITTLLNITSFIHYSWIER